MTSKVNDALSEALECIKASGIIRKYALVWTGRDAAPRIIVWKTADISDEELLDRLRHSLAGLATESQFTIEKD